MRVLLADDHSSVRWALRTFLGEEPGLTVVGEASDANALLAQAVALCPDLILLDWELPGAPVDELLRGLHAPFLSPRVIVLSTYPQAEQAARAAGADGFLSKANGPAALRSALPRLVNELEGARAHPAPLWR